MNDIPMDQIFPKTLPLDMNILDKALSDGLPKYETVEYETFGNMTIFDLQNIGAEGWRPACLQFDRRGMTWSGLFYRVSFQ